MDSRRDWRHDPVELGSREVDATHQSNLWRYSPAPSAKILKWAILALTIVGLINFATPALDWVINLLTDENRLSPGMAIFYFVEAVRDGLWLFVLLAWKGVWNHRFGFRQTDWYYNVEICWSGVLVMTDMLMAAHPDSSTLFALIPMGLWKLGYLTSVFYIVAGIQLLKLPDKLWGLLVPMVVVGIASSVIRIVGPDIPGRRVLHAAFIIIQVIILVRLRRIEPPPAAFPTRH